MEIIWTKKSQQALFSIYEYISADNEILAKEITACILKTIKTTIYNYKHVGKAGRVMGTREFVFSQYPYIIIYAVKNNNLYIVNILHTSKKYP